MVQVTQVRAFDSSYHETLQIGLLTRVETAIKAHLVTKSFVLVYVSQIALLKSGFAYLAGNYIDWTGKSQDIMSNMTVTLVPFP